MKGSPFFVNLTRMGGNKAGDTELPDDVRRELVRNVRVIIPIRPEHRRNKFFPWGKSKSG